MMSKDRRGFLKNAVCLASGLLVAPAVGACSPFHHGCRVDIDLLNMTFDGIPMRTLIEGCHTLPGRFSSVYGEYPYVIEHEEGPACGM